MADPTRPPLDPEMDLLASELAFGLLEGEEQLEARKRALGDSQFAARVAFWEREGLEQFVADPQDEPSPAVWTRIASGLARQPDEGAASTVVPISQSEPTTARTEAQARTVHDPGLWRPFALAASLAALVFAGLWTFATPERVEVPVRAPFAPNMLSVAQINADEDGTLLSALYDREGGRLFLRLAELPDPARVPQLWLIDDGGTPRSLGFGERDAVAELVLTEQQRAIIEETGTIAVSLEQPADVPGDTPTDVLGSASLAPLEES